MTTPIRSWLAAVDLTPGSDRVLARLSLLPLSPDARATVLHVVPGNLPHARRRIVEHDARRALEAEVRHLRSSLPKTVRLRASVTVGSAAREIRLCAGRVGAELILLGRGGGRGLRDALLGSTAERVVRQSRLPVLVVRRPARAAYGRPAVALDLDDAARGALRLMPRVLSSPRLPVDVVHAYEMPYRGLTYASLSATEFEKMKTKFRRDATLRLARLVATAVERGDVPREAASWKTHVGYGSPRTVAERVMRQAQTDLLVLGTRARSGFAHAFLGTVAGGLLRAARCDVLLVPPAPSPRSA